MARLTDAPTIPPASAARSRAIAAAWHKSAAYRTVAAAFAHVRSDDAEALLEAAERLLVDDGWLNDLLAPLIAALRDDPWFEPPLRVNRDGLRSGAILFERPGVTLSLSLLSAAALAAVPEGMTVVCSGRLGLTRYLRAGGARLARWAMDPLPSPLVGAAIEPCRREADRLLADGDLVRHDGRIAAGLVVAANRDVLMLSAAIGAGADPVAREYDRATGRFLRMATNDEGAARAQLLLSLLRASGRPDRAAFDTATRDSAFFLRWSAMREWLACDWRRAWPRLRAMAADDPHPEVRAAAAATIDRLTLKAA